MTRSSFDEELADEKTGSGVESEDDSFSANEPFDPNSISLSSKVVALDAVLRRIKNGTIKLAPPFQRNYVWDAERQSRLIESMMLRIPLPMFYVSEDREGNWEVVDGLQRLTTIRDFVLGPDGDGKGSRLTGLEFWGNMFDGKTFFEIEKKARMPRVVNNIMEAELSFTIINPDTPEKVKRNIFKRINTGGMRLSMQEIRHALYQGYSTQLLIDLVGMPIYKRVVGRTVRDNRMAGRELILRHLAFDMRGWRQFKGDMDTFLSDTMRSLNGEYRVETSPNFDPASITTKFEAGLQRSYKLFGDHAFRRSQPGERKTPINKSLFDVWMFCLGRLPPEAFSIIQDERNIFLEQYHDLLSTDETFIDAIGRYGSDPRGVRLRYETITGLVKEYI